MSFSIHFTDCETNLNIINSCRFNTLFKPKVIKFGSNFLNAQDIEAIIIFYFLKEENVVQTTTKSLLRV